MRAQSTHWVALKRETKGDRARESEMEKERWGCNTPCVQDSRTTDVKEFPILVYNIDKILPCRVCISLSEKHHNVRYMIKMMSTVM